MSNKLDAMVAERVMDLHIEPNLMYGVVCADIVLVEPERGIHSGKRWDGTRRPVESYSSNFSCAMNVIAALEQPKDPEGSYWLAKIVRRLRWHVELRRVGAGDQKRKYINCVNESLPMAICVAALRAVGVSEKEIEEAMR